MAVSGFVGWQQGLSLTALKSRQLIARVVLVYEWGTGIYPETAINGRPTKMEGQPLQTAKACQYDDFTKKVYDTPRRTICYAFCVFYLIRPVGIR